VDIRVLLALQCSISLNGDKPEEDGRPQTVALHHDPRLRRLDQALQGDMESSQ